MPSFEELIRMRVVYSVPGMDHVSARRNIVYKDAAREPLHMDIYSPAGPSKPRPVVILIHGGPIPRLGAKNMGVFVSYGELLAASGFVAVTFDHRFLGADRQADAAADVADLVTHVRADAASLGVDPARVALWAFSGGGQLLAGPLREHPAWLRAAVAYYPMLAGVDAHLAGAPPVLVARAGLDSAALNATVDRFVDAALDGGVALDLLNHPAGRHAFDILDDDDRSRQILRRTLAFLADHLAPQN